MVGGLALVHSVLFIVSKIDFVMVILSPSTSCNIAFCIIKDFLFGDAVKCATNLILVINSMKTRLIYTQNQLQWYNQNQRFNRSNISNLRSAIRKTIARFLIRNPQPSTALQVTLSTLDIRRPTTKGI
jgi:hypothetical protein